jgi:hypothetical protein
MNKPSSSSTDVNVNMLSNGWYSLSFTSNQTDRWVQIYNTIWFSWFFIYTDKLFDTKTRTCTDNASVSYGPLPWVYFGIFFIMAVLIGICASFYPIYIVNLSGSYKLVWSWIHESDRAKMNPFDFPIVSGVQTGHDFSLCLQRQVNQDPGFQSLDVLSIMRRIAVEFIQARPSLLEADKIQIYQDHKFIAFMLLQNSVRFERYELITREMLTSLLEMLLYSDITKTIKLVEFDDYIPLDRHQDMFRSKMIAMYIELFTSWLFRKIKSLMDLVSKNKSIIGDLKRLAISN